MTDLGHGGGSFAIYSERGHAVSAIPHKRTVIGRRGSMRRKSAFDMLSPNGRHSFSGFPIESGLGDRLYFNSNLGVLFQISEDQSSDQGTFARVLGNQLSGSEL